jgi:hypothetical protein
MLFMLFASFSEQSSALPLADVAAETRVSGLEASVGRGA